MGGNIVSGPGIKLVVDPLHEDTQVTSPASPDERRNLREFWASSLQSLNRSTATTSKWTSLRTKEGFLSSEDFLTLDASSMAIEPAVKSYSLLVNVFGRFATFMPPQQIATMSLERLMFVLCLDNAHCERSFRRQNSDDVLKNREELELEGNVRMAALLSLAGCGCVVTTTWSSPLKFHHHFASSVLQNFTDGKKEKLLTCIKSVVDSSKIKRFVQYSNVCFGISALTYSDQ